MPTGRNLVVCCDGTGNVWSPGGGTTNVVRLVRALSRDRSRQICFYDPGVGTPDGYVADGAGGLGWKDRLRRLGGLAWGDGVWTNVAEAYLFLVEHYRPGDRIFLFGFSRGAFTARAVAGVIHLCGLLEREHDNLVPALLKVYRSPSGRTRDEAGEALKQAFSRDGVAVHFTGVWDTVESVGIVRLLAGAHITSNRDVKSTYVHVRHAVALDELRAPYLPRLYAAAEQPLADGRTFKQVHFCGAHSDVGGGYAHDGLSNAALHWMVREANDVGLLVEPDVLDRFAVNPLDCLHDETSRLPYWTLAGIFTRRLPAQGVTIHESVAARMKHPALSYCPHLPPDPWIEQTRIEFTDGDGNRRPWPVPVEATPATPATPARQRVPVWAYIVLAVSAAATAGWLHAWFAEAQPLVQAQLWRGVAGLFDLGGALEAACGGDRACPGRWLLKDALLILSYTAMLPIVLLLLLLRAAGRGGVMRRWLGRGARAAAVLPVADAIENWTTMAAWQAHLEAVCSPFPCSWVEGIYSIACSLAASVKFVALGTVGLIVVACVVYRLLPAGRSA